MSNKKPASSILAFGREIVAEESKAVSGLELDEQFENAVRLIRGMSREGRVIVSGMGKAGFIAMKISATMASTGTPSFFLHPAEAVHGDLGRYTKQDVALLISNSGETEEVLRILPHIKRIGCPIISVTGDSSSTLARHSDVTISVGKLTEAGPHGLAPTTSTTVMLVLGDALAMTVMSLRELSKEEFAYYHPGGNLGRSLMTVSDVMRTGEEHCIVREDMLARDVLHQITTTKGRPGAATIVSAQGNLVGIFTDGDLRRCLDQQADFLNAAISQVMGKSPKTISSDKLAQEALRIMTEKKIDQLIVVSEKGLPVGMIDIQDLVGVGKA